MNYHVTINREGKNWIAQCEENPAAIDYGTSLPKILKGMKDAIVLSEDLPDEADPSITLVPSSTLPSELAEAIRLADQRAKLNKANSELRQSTQQAVSNLLASGYSIRETASALGITPGRVQQLA